MNQHTANLPTTREQESKFGTQIMPDGVRFRLWAPKAQAVSVQLYEPEQIIPMHSLPRGWFEVEVKGAEAGRRYHFVVDSDAPVPDPASRFQPDDVDGPSEVIAPRAFAWSDVGWRGKPWEEAILYEVHVGTFTPEGTFAAAIDKLDHLVDLGITAVQLMPIGAFPGRWNWGYDGALLFAPDREYGRPEDLKSLIDACHAKGLMILLDVVYNHFGPKGNYMGAYAPLFTEGHSTPWGSAVNYDDEGSSMVRDFVIANARYWLNEFHFDGLRFDAVHEIQDSSAVHMLEELAQQLRSATDGRHIHLVAENSRNETRWLARREDGRPLFYTAQWSDDIHHLLHCAATGERFWYYADYIGRPDWLGRALAEGCAYQGQVRARLGENWGEPSVHLPATAFVSFLQNHDHIGNRPFGERIGHLVPERTVRALATIILLSPQIPMVFMGEEWGASQPFHFFSDVGEELAASIQQGREDEIKDVPLPEGTSVPDPMAEATFLASKLDWDERSGDASQRLHAFYRKLIGLRRERLVPRLVGMAGKSGTHERLGEAGLRVVWTLGDGSEYRMIANLSNEPLEGLEVWSGDHLWIEGYATSDVLEPWSVVVQLVSALPAGARGT